MHCCGFWCTHDEMPPQTSSMSCSSLLLVDDESESMSDSTVSGHSTDESQVTFSVISGSTVISMVGMVGVDSDLHISGVDVCTLAAFTLLII